MMEIRLHAQPKNAPPTSFTPVRGGVLQRKCACGGAGVEGECEGCDKKQLSLQRSTQNSEHETRNAGGVPPIVNEVLRSPGQPLDAQTRAFMEPRFGHDFSKVRVHTDARAAVSARAVNSLAYTVGQDLVFGLDRYRPGTLDGQRLVAHELAHVVQQGGSESRIDAKLEVGSPDNAFEAEADMAAQAVISGGSIYLVPTSVAQHIQREMVEEPAAGCGVCASPTITGTFVHTVATEAFGAAYPQEVIPHAGFHNPADQEDGELDLLRITNTHVEIGEIKPNHVKGNKHGYKDLKAYRLMLREVTHIRGISIEGQEIGGLTLRPPGSLTYTDTTANCPAEQKLLLEGPFGGEGLYVYSCNPPRSTFSKANCCEGEREPERQPVLDPGIEPVIVATLVEATRRALAKQGAKAVATKVPVVRYISCIAGILILASGRARAGGLEGEDPLLMLLESGIPPEIDPSATKKETSSDVGEAGQEAVEIPPEILEILENDPELKQIVEKGLEGGGNPSAAQMELAQQMLKVISENRDEFSDEDLELLLAATEAGSAEVAELDVSAETLRQRIEQAKEAKQSDESKSAKKAGESSSANKGQAGGSNVGSEIGETDTPNLAKGDSTKLGKGDSTIAGRGGMGSEGRQTSKAGGQGGVGTKAGDTVPISEEAQKRLAASPANVRSLYEKWIDTGDKEGPQLTTEFLNWFLNIVPLDLNEDELAELKRAATPVPGATASEDLDKLERSIRLLRAMPDTPMSINKDKDDSLVGPRALEGKEPSLPGSTGTEPTGTKTDPKDTEDTGGAGAKIKAPKTDEDALDRIIKRVYAFDWSSLEQGKLQLQSYKGLKEPVSAALYGRTSTGAEFGAEVMIVYIKSGEKVDVKIISSSELFIPGGPILSGSYLVGKVIHDVVDVKHKAAGEE